MVLLVGHPNFFIHQMKPEQEIVLRKMIDIAQEIPSDLIRSIGGKKFA